MPLKLARRKGSQVWYITGTVAGQRVREATGTADKRLAEEARGIREAELLRAAIYGKPALKLTWDDACLSYVEVTAPSVGTRALLTRLTDHFGRMRLTDIKQAEIDRAAATLCRPDAAPATRLRNVIVPTRAVLMHAARRGWCDPPMIEKVVGAAGGRRTRWLTPPEYSAQRDAATAALAQARRETWARAAEIAERVAIPEDCHGVEAHGRLMAAHAAADAIRSAAAGEEGK